MAAWGPVEERCPVTNLQSLVEEAPDRDEVSLSASVRDGGVP